MRQENLDLFIDTILEIRFSNTFLCCITPDMFKKSGFRHLEVSHELQNPSFCLLSTVIPMFPLFLLQAVRKPLSPSVPYSPTIALTSEKPDTLPAPTLGVTRRTTRPAD